MSCLAHADVKTFRKLSKDAIRCLRQEGELLDSEPAIRVLETVLANADGSPKMHESLARSVFDGKLLAWARHPVGNFTIQRLLDSCGTKEMVGSRFALC